MSDNPTGDPRVLRTQGDLWLALLDLLHAHDWDAINVRMICDTAGVARSSFYVHFGNKISLLDFGFAQVLDEVKQRIRNTPREPGRLATVAWLVDHIGANTGFFERASNTPSGQAVFSRFKAAAGKVLANELTTIDAPADGLEIDFVVGGCFAVIQRWVNGGCTSPADALKTRLNRFAGQVLAI